MNRRDALKFLVASPLLVPMAEKPKVLETYRFAPDFNAREMSRAIDTESIRFSWLDIYSPRHEKWVPIGFLKREQDSFWTRWRWSTDTQSYFQEPNGPRDPHYPGRIA